MAVAAEGEWILAVQRVCSLLGAERTAAWGALYESIDLDNRSIVSPRCEEKACLWGRGVNRGSGMVW